MALRQATLAKAADRRRFVSADAAVPYLDGCRRRNALRAYRAECRAIEAALRRPHYGTASALRTAYEVQERALNLYRAAERISDARTPIERRARARAIALMSAAAD
jgi:hypothetical protein